MALPLLASTMGCMFSCPRVNHFPGYEDPMKLASEMAFTASEVEALYELYKKLRSSITEDRLIHKEEFQLALFRDSNMKNLFSDGDLRLDQNILVAHVFDLFDIKRNGVIDFGEFVRSLSIFHPNAPEEEKIAFAFKLYDLRHTGHIECGELKEMVLALLIESDIYLSEDIVETIVNKSFSEADSKGDGRIDIDEWRDFVKKNPSLMRNMTLPYLKDVALSFPSFIVHSEPPLMQTQPSETLLIITHVDLHDLVTRQCQHINYATPKGLLKEVVPA